MKKTFFSIIIPVYNRADEVKRAILSCLNQEYTHFEIVVVDDGSNDDTVNNVRILQDQHKSIRLIEHAHNRGVCEARNTAISHSTGEWLLLLDSDDELLPDALQTIARYVDDCSNDIARIGFAYKRDDGGISPDPLPSNTILDYSGFLVWRQSVVSSSSDFFHCTRRDTFEKVRFSPGRTYEDVYLLDFAVAYRTQMVPEFVALIHTDSENRASNLSLAERANGFLRDAHDQYLVMETLLCRHGQALSMYTPRQFRTYQKARVIFALLDGQKANGSLLAWKYLNKYPLCFQGWIIWIAGLIGSSFLARLKAWKG